MDTKKITKEKYLKILQEEKKNLLNYEQRLTQLVKFVKENKILPILLTQPALYGNSIDPSSGFNLSTVKIGNLNGEVSWELLNHYNKATIKVAEKENIPFIDLSFLLEKDSKYYWDFIHYSNEGNKKIGEILTPKIRNIIDKNLIN